MPFTACRVFENNSGMPAKITKLEVDELTEGDVIVKVDYSGINYKDALAATGRGKIVRRFPLNIGVDLAGIVVESSTSQFVPGQTVLVNGCGMGERFDGGLAEYARVKSEWLIPMPEGLDSRVAMILGTAGFTAMLCIHRMEENHQSPDKGPVVVTGATGGVGSIALLLLSQLGYETVAVTSRRPEFESYLTLLGASEVAQPADLGLGSRPLEKARFGGVIDNVGGALLSQLYTHTHLWGNIACVGMAASQQLEATVFPLILRGVSLLGISSTNCPMPLRRALWQRLGRDFDFSKLSHVAHDTVALSEVLPCFERVLDRKVHGRYLVKCSE